ncbi:hypothetical protein GE09DRAFT_1078841 [Coniochaeta sp. 2T2.1]|nr:hypothetical protein GE09DRAFT_1078841 [Coniochaeta sp. 2T2.1]
MSFRRIGSDDRSPYDAGAVLIALYQHRFLFLSNSNRHLSSAFGTTPIFLVNTVSDQHRFTHYGITSILSSRFAITQSSWLPAFLIAIAHPLQDNIDTIIMSISNGLPDKDVPIPSIEPGPSPADVPIMSIEPAREPLDSTLLLYLSYGSTPLVHEAFANNMSRLLPGICISVVANPQSMPQKLALNPRAVVVSETFASMELPNPSLNQARAAVIEYVQQRGGRAVVVRDALEFPWALPTSLDDFFEQAGLP